MAVPQLIEKEKVKKIKRRGHWKCLVAVLGKFIEMR